MLTAARPSEARLAVRDELDLDAATWTIPAERMKMNRAHRVPLSDRALSILDEARTLRDGTGLVFPAGEGRPLRPEAFWQALKRLGIDATPHGFRSSFRMWVAEKTNFPREIAEAALAHQVGDATERAYQRSDLFDRRVELMDRWARYLSGEEATVVSLRARRTG